MFASFSVPRVAERVSCVAGANVSADRFVSSRQPGQCWFLLKGTFVRLYTNACKGTRTCCYMSQCVTECIFTLV